MPADPLIRKKVEQAMKLMAEQGVDCWIAQLGQETWSHPDPVQALVVGTSVTWPSAFLVTAAGATIALGATGDVGNVRRAGAYERGEGYFQAMGAWLRPGLGERDVFEFAHAQMRRRQLQPSWDGAYDPGVNIGPKQRLGHAGPGEARLAPGDLVHVDLGVIVDGFASDLQRVWYLRRRGESVASQALLEAFAAVDAAIQAGAA